MVLELEKVNLNSILKVQTRSEMVLTNQLIRSISNVGSNGRVLFDVLESSEGGFNGSIWWISTLQQDVSVVLVGNVNCNGIPAALVSGYILGELNNLENEAKTLLMPKTILEHLNKKLIPMFKSSGVTANVWCGVFNYNEKKLIFVSANHAAPFVIGPERQVSNVFVDDVRKSKPLGVKHELAFEESCINISSGSKLVICTEDLLEKASRIGDKYDPNWLVQVLETIGDLPLHKMCKSLECILSENIDGTGKSAPRLALLLEIPS